MLDNLKAWYWTRNRLICANLRAICAASLTWRVQPIDSESLSESVNCSLRTRLHLVWNVAAYDLKAIEKASGDSPH